jgi:hypothetical protein
MKMRGGRKNLRAFVHCGARMLQCKIYLALQHEYGVEIFLQGEFFSPVSWTFPP